LQPAVYGLFAALVLWLATPGGHAQEAAPDTRSLPAFGVTVVVPYGLRGEIYPIREGSRKLPNFQKLEPVGTIYTSSLNVPARNFSEGFPGVTRRFEWFAIDYSGRFWIEQPDQYRFSLESDDGSRLYIDGRLVINNDGVHPPQTVTKRISLNGGVHRIRVSYFQGPRFHVALVLRIAGPDEDFRVFSTEEFRPPRNPDEWKFGDPNDLTIPPDPNAGRRKLRDILKQDRKK
jgi:hypothetical protein